MRVVFVTWWYILCIFKQVNIKNTTSLGKLSTFLNYNHCNKFISTYHQQTSLLIDFLPLCNKILIHKCEGEENIKCVKEFHIKCNQFVQRELAGTSFHVEFYSLLIEITFTFTSNDNSSQMIYIRSLRLLEKKSIKTTNKEIICLLLGRCFIIEMMWYVD